MGARKNARPARNIKKGPSLLYSGPFLTAKIRETASILNMYSIWKSLMKFSSSPVIIYVWLPPRQNKRIAPRWPIIFYPERRIYFEKNTQRRAEIHKWPTNFTRRPITITLKYFNNQFKKKILLLKKIFSSKLISRQFFLTVDDKTGNNIYRECWFPLFGLSASGRGK